MLSEFRMVELEIHSYCNRVCPWCPNRDGSRKHHTEMPERMYMKILNELKDNGFNGVVSYSRYNEPMSHPELFKKRVAQAKHTLPNSLLVSNTNGDYLSFDNLNGLLIDELTVMDYECKGERACMTKMMSCGITIDKVDYPYIHGRFYGMKVLYFVDWTKHVELEDRGGSLNLSQDRIIKKMKCKNDNTIRTRACFEPTYFIGIDYDGNVTPCCHIRAENHIPYVLGNVGSDSLVDILRSERACLIRDTAQDGRMIQVLSPCQHCQKDEGRYTRDNATINYGGK